MNLRRKFINRKKPGYPLQSFLPLRGKKGFPLLSLAPHGLTVAVKAEPQNRSAILRLTDAIHLRYAQLHAIARNVLCLVTNLQA
jgi:hypothetical protein